MLVTSVGVGVGVGLGFVQRQVPASTATDQSGIPQGSLFRSEPPKDPAQNPSKLFFCLWQSFLTMHTLVLCLLLGYAYSTLASYDVVCLQYAYES